MTEIISKPDYGVRLVTTEDGKASLVLQIYLDELEEQLNANLLGTQVQLTSYTADNPKDTLPVDPIPGGLIFVTDIGDAGTGVPAFSDNDGAWRSVVTGDLI